MTTPRQEIARHATQAQLSSFFIDQMKFYNVKTYGAVGDGIIDDTTNINRAMAAATTNNATILYYSPGTYKVTSVNFSTNFDNLVHVGDNAFFNGSTAAIRQAWTPTNFITLGDVPASYIGNSGKAVLVNGTENGLSFVSLRLYARSFMLMGG